MLKKFLSEVQVWHSPQVATALVAIAIVTVMFAIYLLRVILNL